MNQAAPAIQDLARLLLALEANRSEPAQEDMHVALSVFEKLRLSLSKLVGVAGYQALLVRAVALAKIETGWLESVRVSGDARLEGFQEIIRQLPAEVVMEGSKTLLAQLLALLILFIGEALTLRLVGDVWPEARVEIMNSGSKETQA